ncbi:PAS-domain containing protein [Paracoccus zeaxanthinifaciens]|uniref:PAS-domain containing protein n=1 Tax=Paracoccus zeaxanthinifaciens TaxID=187400 RepID=UPI0003B35990
MTRRDLRDPLTMASIDSDLVASGLNMIGQALSIFDDDLRLRVGNMQYQRMFGLPPKLTRPGASFEDTIRFLVLRGEYGPQDDPDDAVAFRVAQARTFQPHYFERRRADGRWIAVEGAPLSQGGWVTVYTDITHIKEQERLLRARSDALSNQVLLNAERLAAANRELAATNAALSEAQRVLTRTEARTRQVTQMVPAHIAHMDANFRYTFSNRRLAAIFPGAAKDIVGLTLEQALGRETCATLLPYMARALEGDAQVFEITHPGSGRRIRIALTPDHDGHGVYILSTDVSAEVQAREALAHAGKRTLAAQMTAGMAHDFGNLLTIILGLQGRLAARDLPPDAQDDVQGTLAAARRGAALLDRLARISGPRDPVQEPADPAALLTEVAQLARPALSEGAELRLILDLPPGKQMLDAGALQDAVLNLILNADAAMPGGGRITLDAHRTGDWLSIEVADQGTGFAPEALSRATEPFFTTKKGQGSGLGLSMVYDMAKLSGGTLRIGNDPSGGARVVLRLPWRPVAPRMILLVEDDDQIRAQVRDQLTSLGHSVIEAASLSEARALSDLPGLDAVLTDIQLGDGLGLDLAGARPMVAMTSLPPGHPLREGADCAVLTKPFTTARLAATLLHAIPDAP